MVASRIGEVLESSTTEFRAACDELHGPPPFGSLVLAGNGDEDVIGLVFEAATAGADPGRPTVVRGRDEPDEAAVFHNNPQLARLLRTDIRALVVGSIVDGRVRQRLPARPARVHAFLHPAGDERVRRFFETLEFLGLITGAKLSLPADELIAASLRLAIQAGVDERLLVRAGRELVILLGGNAVRLNAILRQARP